MLKNFVFFGNMNRLGGTDFGNKKEEKEKKKLHNAYCF